MGRQRMKSGYELIHGGPTDAAWGEVYRQVDSRLLSWSYGALFGRLIHVVDSSIQTPMATVIHMDHSELFRERLERTHV